MKSSVACVSSTTKQIGHDGQHGVFDEARVVMGMASGPRLIDKISGSAKEAIGQKAMLGDARRMAGGQPQEAAVHPSSAKSDDPLCGCRLSVQKKRYQGLVDRRLVSLIHGEA